MDHCPQCGVLIEQRTDGQNAGFHAVCTALSKQRDWPRGSGIFISVTAWKRLIMAAFERAHGRKAEIHPSIDRDGWDVVYRRSSRMARSEMAELIPYAEAWAVDQGVVFKERKAA